MAPSVETKIWMAIKSRVEAMQTTLPILMPAQASVVAPLTKGYFRVGRVTAAPVRMLVADGKPHERTGMVVITLVRPVGRDDIAVYDQIAGTVAEHFKDGTAMRYADVCVTVPRYPHVQEGYEDNGYWTVPVRIPWRCFA